MKRTIKKLFSLFLVLTVLFGMAVPAFAAEEGTVVMVDIEGYNEAVVHGELHVDLEKTIATREAAMDAYLNGATISYAWFENGSKVVNYSECYFTFEEHHAGSQFQVVVYVGSVAIKSQMYTVEWKTPKIIEQPEDVSIIVGENAVFDVVGGSYTRCDWYAIDGGKKVEWYMVASKYGIQYQLAGLNNVKLTIKDVPLRGDGIRLFAKLTNTEVIFIKG